MRLLFLVPAMLLPAASVAAPLNEGPSAVAYEPSLAHGDGDMPVIAPAGPSSDKCPPTSRYHAVKGKGPLMGRKLNELPAADHYKAVYRRIGECEVPIIAGYNVGGR
jgi:hypothetical protein